MTISNTVRPMPMSASPNQAPAPEAASAEGIVINEDLLKVNDPEYNEAYTDLADLKRVKKGLENPARMDIDIYQHYENMSKEKVEETCDKVSKYGKWTLVGSAVAGTAAVIVVGPLASLGVILPLLAVGNLLLFDGYKKIAGRRLEKETIDTLMAESRKSIDSDISGSEARLAEIREKALARAMKKLKQDNESAVDKSVQCDALEDEDDFIMIGGIKLKKHTDAAGDEAGGLIHFLRNSIYCRA
ncbi:MAG: hypothetical protein AB9903_05270 [Vulcanimicrobiota bacterium]